MKSITCLFALLVLLVGTAPANAGGDINFLAGTKILSLPDSLYDGEGERHFDSGIMTSWSSEGWPVCLAVDVLHSVWFVPAIFIVGESMTTTEIDVGIRKFYDDPTTRPYVGGGLGMMRGTYDLDVWWLGNVASVDKWTVGIWADGGVMFRLGSHFNLGIDVRYSWARIDIDEYNVENANIGGFHFNGFLGFGW